MKVLSVTHNNITYGDPPPDCTYIHDTLRNVTTQLPWFFPTNFCIHPNNVVVIGSGQQQQHQQSSHIEKEDDSSASATIQSDDDDDDDDSSGGGGGRSSSVRDTEIPSTSGSGGGRSSSVRDTEIDEGIPSTDLNEIDAHNQIDEEMPGPSTIDKQIDDDKKDEIIISLDEVIRQKLSVRAYHLPGNNYCEDWRDYVRNNHLVFGLFCHDSLHPVKNKHRIILLIGSLSFGLVVTNVVYLWGDSVKDADDILHSWGERVYNETDLSILVDKDVHIAGQSLHLDASQLGILWTLGSGCHSMFDFCLWHMIACGYCKNNKKFDNTTGWSIAVSITVLVVCITCVMVYFRAFGHEENDSDENENDDDDALEIPYASETDQLLGILDYVDFQQPDFRFLYGYLIELVLSLFVYSVVVQSIMFSGICGCCGRVMVLGGRPREIRNMRKQYGDEKNVMVEI